MVIFRERYSEQMNLWLGRGEIFVFGLGFPKRLYCHSTILGTNSFLGTKPIFVICLTLILCKKDYYAQKILVHTFRRLYDPMQPVC